jgi:integrase
MIDDILQHFKKKGASTSSLNKISACISKSLNLAVDRGWLDKKPKIDWITTNNNRLRYLIKEEEAYLVQILTAKQEIECKDFFLFLLDTGLRRGEALRLSCRDVDLDKGTLSVWETKNGNPRTVPLTTRVKNILETRIDTEGRLKNKPIFNLTEEKIRRVWEWLRSNMGLEDDKEFVLHSLRHTCASRLVQRGIQLQVVQQWLGHKSINMTLRYAHLDTQNLLDASKVLESNIA